MIHSIIDAGAGIGMRFPSPIEPAGMLESDVQHISLAGFLVRRIKDMIPCGKTACDRETTPGFQPCFSCPSCPAQ